MGQEAVNETAHRRLRISLIAGSLYDIAFAAVTLAAPGFGAVFFAIPLPEQQVYLRFTGVFLIILAVSIAQFTYFNKRTTYEIA